MVAFSKKTEDNTVTHVAVPVIETTKKVTPIRRHQGRTRQNIIVLYDGTIGRSNYSTARRRS